MTAAPTAPQSIMVICRGVFIELMRRKDIHVLLIFMGLYFVATTVVAIVGIGNPQTATFLLNLGLTMTWFFAHLLTLILVSRQIPGEIDNRTLYPLLARPLTRQTYLIGKWVGCTIAGVLVLLTLGLIAWLPVPKLEEYNTTLLLQLLVLHVFSIAMMCAFTLLLSLVSPQGITIIVMGILLLLGGRIIDAGSGLLEGSSFNGVVRWVFQYLPNFSDLNLVTRYTDGIAPLTGSEFVGLVGVSAIFTLFALALAVSVFDRKRL